MGVLRILAFQNPEFKISADFNILALQKSEFQIMAAFKILAFPESWIKRLVFRQGFSF